MNRKIIKKEILAGLVTGALLFLAVGVAQATPIPATIHVNDGPTYLYNGETHALTDPALITINSPGVTIDDLFLALAVPGDTQETVGTVSGTDSDGNSFGPTGADLMGYVDGTTGHTFAYDDVLGVAGNNSQQYVNYHDIDLAVLSLDESQFDIYRYDTGATLYKPDTFDASFSSLPLGTFVFAYGYGDDGKLYCTPITETGLETGPPVPEPATMLLFGIGLVGVAGVSRRRKKNENG